MKFDQELNAIIVNMPKVITLDILKKWRKIFLELLVKRHANKKVALSLDTNRHDFESIECIKLLRELLSKNMHVNQSISRIAFVQPVNYREPEIVNSTEAYFSQAEDAQEWLKRQQV